MILLIVVLINWLIVLLTKCVNTERKCSSEFPRLQSDVLCPTNRPELFNLLSQMTKKSSTDKEISGCLAFLLEKWLKWLIYYQKTSANWWIDRLLQHLLKWVSGHKNIGSIGKDCHNHDQCCLQEKVLWCLTHHGTLHHHHHKVPFCLKTVTVSLLYMQSTTSLWACNGGTVPSLFSSSIR